MKTQKKNGRSKIILCILVACCIVGLSLTVVLFNQNPGRTYASASLQFSFNGAGEGRAPNGYPFDVNGILSEEVLTKALEASELQNTYTTEQIKENLTVTGVYPENIVKQMTAYNSLLDEDADQQAAMADYHATQYSVVLYHDFDPKIPSAQLTKLLNNILDAYRAYFIKTNAPGLQKTEPITDLSEYDYSQQLLAISKTVDQQSHFAQEMTDLAPDFRKDRKGFDDIVVSYSNLKSDIDRLNASVTLNTVSKDRERLQKQYSMELRTLNRQLEADQEELKHIEELVASYEKDGIVYISTSDSLRKISDNAADTYDKLVAKRKELTDSISAANADIKRYQTLLNDMTNDQAATAGTATAGNTATTDGGETEETVSTSAELTEEDLKQLAASTEKQIEMLTAKKNKVASDFTDMLDAYSQQEINERTVSVSSLKYKTPSVLSGTFIVKAIKTAGPICVLGFIVCLVLLIISMRKEEKAK